LNNIIRIAGINYPIQQGNHTGNTLAAALKTALDLQGAPKAPHVVTYSLVTGRLNVITNDLSSTAFQLVVPSSANEALGLPVGGATILSGQDFNLPVFLGTPLSLGIQIDQSSDVGYITAGWAYRFTTERVVVEGKTTLTQAYTQAHRENTLIVPWVAASGVFNYIDNWSNPQTVKFAQPTKTLRIRVMDTETGTVVSLNNCAWEIMIERMEECITPFKKRKIHELEQVATRMF
jgi:hypothetical protein